MKRSTRILLAGLVLFVVSIACEATTPTPSAADVAMTMIGDQVNAQATQAKFASIAEVTAQVAAATSTQQAVWVQATQSQQARLDSEATAAKADANAQATSYQARMDAQATQQRIDLEATQVQARLDAESTAEQARIDALSTQQAAGTSTAFVITQTAIPPMNTMTAISQSQDIQLKENEVQLSSVKVKQQWDTNVIQWLVPMLFAIAAAYVGARYLANVSRVREVKDAEGNTDVLIFDNEKLIATKLMPKPILMLVDNEMPDVTHPSEQSEIVRREQGIRALEVMPERPTDYALDTYADMFHGPQRDQLPTIEFVPPDRIGTEILEEIEGQVMEEE